MLFLESCLKLMLLSFLYCWHREHALEEKFNSESLNILSRCHISIMLESILFICQPNQQDYWWTLLEILNTYIKKNCQVSTQAGFYQLLWWVQVYFCMACLHWTTMLAPGRSVVTRQGSKYHRYLKTGKLFAQLKVNKKNVI